MTPIGRELDARLWELTGGTVVARDWPCYLDDETGGLIADIKHRDLPDSGLVERHPVYVPDGGVWSPDKDTLVCVEPVPPFSTDDDAALLLCMRIQAMGGDVAIYLSGSPGRQQPVRVNVRAPGGWWRLGHAVEAATLHEAVAQATWAALAPEGE